MKLIDFLNATTLPSFKDIEAQRGAIEIFLRRRKFGRLVGMRNSSVSKEAMKILSELTGDEYRVFSFFIEKNFLPVNELDVETIIHALNKLGRVGFIGRITDGSVDKGIMVHPQAEIAYYFVTTDFYTAGVKHERN